MDNFARLRSAIDLALAELDRSERANSWHLAKNDKPNLTLIRHLLTQARKAD